MRASGGSAAPLPLISTKCACGASRGRAFVRRQRPPLRKQPGYCLRADFPLAVYYFLLLVWTGRLYCSKRSREFALKATRGASESLASTCRCVSTPSCTHAHARGHQHTCAELFFCVSASGPGFQQQEAEPRPLLLLACSPPVASGAAAGTPAAPRHGSAGEEAFERPG